MIYNIVRLLYFKNRSITWISGRIHEDVEGGLIVNTSIVTKGEHPIILDTTIVAAVMSPVITKALDLLVSEIQKRISQKKEVKQQTMRQRPSIPPSTPIQQIDVQQEGQEGAITKGVTSSVDKLAQQPPLQGLAQPLTRQQ